MEHLRKHGGKLIFSYLIGFLMLSLLNIILMTENMVLLSMIAPPLTAVLVLAFYLLYYGGAANITISAIYKDDSSISLFFKGVYRNFWKLFKVHFLIAIMAAIPVILILTVISRGNLTGTLLFSLFDMIFSILFYLLLLYLSFFVSILVIKDQFKVWPALKKAFLSLKKEFRNILTAVLYTAGVQLFTAISLTGIFLIIVILFNLDQINNQAMMVQLTYLGGMIFQSVFSFALICGLPVFVKKYKDTIEPRLFPEPPASDASEKN
ncbi:MAG: hypothetical protein WB502_11640 [Thermoactinomyces sp.]